MSAAQPVGRRWRPPARIKSPWLRRSLWLGALLYFVLAIGSVEVDMARLNRGLERAPELFAAFFRPDFVTRWYDIYLGIVESLTMTVVSTAVGVFLALPVAYGAARNMSPLPIYLVCRGFIAISRSFQEVIIALFFVVMIGFGPLAGALTLAFATVGFLAKLLAEDIEDIDETQVEALKSTGATWLQRAIFAVWPQVKPRFIGLSVYRLDINFRESSVIGVVGAGGIGATLNTAFDRYDFSSASAILLIIIAIVLVAESLSGIIRQRVQ